MDWGRVTMPVVGQLERVCVTGLLRQPFTEASLAPLAIECGRHETEVFTGISSA